METPDDQPIVPDPRRERRREDARRRRVGSPTHNSRLVLALQAALGLLALVVVTGLALLWPDGGKINRPESRLPATLRAEVIAVEKTGCSVRDTDACLQAKARLLSGRDEGDIAEFVVGEAGAEVEVGVGDKVRVIRNKVPVQAEIDGVDIPPYSFNDFERRGPTYALAAAFALLVLVAGRWHGLRALAGLVASLGVVVLFIVPALLEGRQPLLVALFGALAVMLLTIPVAHGIGPKTIAATFGTTLSLLLTLGLALLFTKLAHLTGFSGDEITYLRTYVGDLSIQGLLLAGVVIGALGVLDDVTVSQASTVMALRAANETLPFRELFTRATSVGRDHITATVNTLVLAYAGASLPILLTFSLGQAPFQEALNSEAVASQVIATLVGSIGLITAVPITTAVAAALAVRFSTQDLAQDTSHGHVH